MIKIRKVSMPENKQSIKCPYAMTPTRIVIHNTANNASAANEISYMQGNTNETSFHFAVDDIEAVQGIELTRNAFHAGDGANGKGNREGIAIEICYSTGDQAKFEKAQENAAELTAYLLNKYGWGMDISRITKHQDYSGKYCPHRTLDDYGWDYFLNLVKQAYRYMYEEEEAMTADEKKAFEALQAKCTDLENQISKLTDKVGPCVTSINWDAHVTGDAGGKEAVAMLHDMKDKRYFAGLVSSHYGLSKQMCRLMLIFYRMLNKICDKNNLTF